MHAKEMMMCLQSAEAQRVDVEDAQPLSTYPRAVQEHISKHSSPKLWTAPPTLHLLSSLRAYSMLKQLALSDVSALGPMLNTFGLSLRS